jgi:hypothetical protein
MPENKCPKRIGETSKPIKNQIRQGEIMRIPTHEIETTHREKQNSWRSLVSEIVIAVPWNSTFHRQTDRELLK